MEVMREALLRLVKAGEQAKELDTKLMDLGYSTTPYGLIFGEIADAVYLLIGEENPFDDFRDSTTYQVMTDKVLTDQSKADLLMSEYRQNNCQRSPVFTDPEKMADMVRKTGGYMTPEGDWK